MDSIIGRKGQGGWAEVLMTVFIAAAVTSVAFQIPKMVQDLTDLLAVASAEGTARNLAGLITISGASTDSIEIVYEGEGETIVYDVIIKDRMVTITGLRNEGDPIEELKKLDTPITEGWAKIAVGDLSKFFIGAKVFIIEKNRTVEGDGATDYYDVLARVVR
jgi:hypothetical protein